MIVRRYGWCATCHAYIMVTREFVVTVNMFDPASNSVPPDVKKELIKWRAEEIYCEPHTPIPTAT